MSKKGWYIVARAELNAAFRQNSERNIELVRANEINVEVQNWLSCFEISTTTTVVPLKSVPRKRQYSKHNALPSPGQPP
ncbi:hypothetical protein M0804_005697 [Polistes exclamans]|nr:hypothetical protein M0804_005697 [Polistes exclamans]